MTVIYRRNKTDMGQIFKIVHTTAILLAQGKGAAGSFDADAIC